MARRTYFRAAAADTQYFFPVDTATHRWVGWPPRGCCPAGHNLVWRTDWAPPVHRPGTPYASPTVPAAVRTAENPARPGTVAAASPVPGRVPPH